MKKLQKGLTKKKRKRNKNQQTPIYKLLEKKKTHPRYWWFLLQSLFLSHPFIFQLVSNKIVHTGLPTFHFQLSNERMVMEDALSSDCRIFQTLENFRHLKSQGDHKHPLFILIFIPSLHLKFDNSPSM